MYWQEKARCTLLHSGQTVHASEPHKKRKPVPEGLQWEADRGGRRYTHCPAVKVDGCVFDLAFAFVLDCAMQSLTTITKACSDL
jgi:hypothetical protein